MKTWEENLWEAILNLTGWQQGKDKQHSICMWHVYIIDNPKNKKKIKNPFPLNWTVEAMDCQNLNEII